MPKKRYIEPYKEKLWHACTHPDIDMHSNWGTHADLHSHLSRHTLPHIIKHTFKHTQGLMDIFYQTHNTDIYTFTRAWIFTCMLLTPSPHTNTHTETKQNKPASQISCDLLRVTNKQTVTISWINLHRIKINMLKVKIFCPLYFPLQILNKFFISRS